jgi:ATP-binding cassette subfamily B protein
VIRYLRVIVVVLALASASRFYFVSWLGERAFFEESRPSEIASRLTADTTVIEQVVGTTARRGVSL